MQSLGIEIDIDMKNYTHTHIYIYIYIHIYTHRCTVVIFLPLNVFSFSSLSERMYVHEGLFKRSSRSGLQDVDGLLHTLDSL